jgi:uncharacterized OB-fold protein
MAKNRTPVVTGWFTDPGDAAEFRLLGTRCRDCGAVFFPREDHFCRNPACSGTDLGEVPLSRRGRVWSYADGAGGRGGFGAQGLLRPGGR